MTAQTLVRSLSVLACEVFRHVGKNNSDRFSADQLGAKLAELAK